MSLIFVPGRGMVDLSMTQVDRAVREYDERLLFATHPETGQPGIFIKMERDFEWESALDIGGDRVVAVCMFRDVPSPDEALRKLHQSDSMRHGEQMLDDIHRHNNAIKAQGEYRASEGTGVAAEVHEFLHRKSGDARYHHSFRKVVKS